MQIVNNKFNHRLDIGIIHVSWMDRHLLKICNKNNVGTNIHGKLIYKNGI